ncbi:MAG: hypothetical protein QE271_08365 [Bacteriovoracaceae bacterium]|nr:hypothetical protein [Bacteriovoracaceae bacterium]
MSMGIKFRVQTLILIGNILLFTGCEKKNSRVYDSNAKVSPLEPSDQKPNVGPLVTPTDLKGALALELNVEGEQAGTKNFGTVLLNDRIESNASIVNVGDQDAILSKYFLSDDLNKNSDFHVIDKNNCLSMIKVQEKCNFKIRFSPRVVRNYQEKLTFQYENKDLSQKQSLSTNLLGTSSRYGKVSITFHDIYGDDLNFGKIPVGSRLLKRIVVRNIGQLSVMVESMNIPQIDSQNIFVIASRTTKSDCGQLILPDSECTVPVIFLPLKEKKYNANLELSYKRSIHLSSNRLTMAIRGEGKSDNQKICYQYEDQDIFPLAKVNPIIVDSKHPAPGNIDFDNGVIVNGDYVRFPYLFGYPTPRVGDHVLVGAPLALFYGTEFKQLPGTTTEYVQNAQVLVRFEFKAKNLENLDSFYAHINEKKLIVDSEKKYPDTELFCFVIKDSRACSGIRYYQTHWESLLNQNFWNKNTVEQSFDGSPVRIARTENSNPDLNDFSYRLRSHFDLLSDGKKELSYRDMVDLSEIYDRPTVSRDGQILNTKSWQDLLGHGVYNMITADDVRHASMPWLTIRTKAEKACD